MKEKKKLQKKVAKQRIEYFKEEKYLKIQNFV